MKKLNKILIASILISAMGVAQAELSALQKQVIADQSAMHGMTAEQRRDFRAQIFANADKIAQRAYNRAFKEMKEANMMPTLTDVGTVKIVKSKAQRIPGTQIIYDTGTSIGIVSGTTSFSQGNIFNSAWHAPNSAINPVETSGSITAATFEMLVVNSTDAYLSVFSNIVGTSANALYSINAPATIGMNTHVFATPVNYSNGPFLVGIWQFGAGEAIAFDAGTVNGQGFHGMEINDLAGTGFTMIPNLNAIMRVSGNVTTPVELMNFSVE